MAVAAVTGAVTGMVTALPGTAGAAAGTPAPGATGQTAARQAAASQAGDGTGTGFFDARSRVGARQVRAAAAIEGSAGVQALRRSLGGQSLVDIDPSTGTPRQVARVDGFLTGPSTAKAPAVVLGYVRAQRAVFGLSDADLTTLVLRKDYVDVAGTHHLSWEQRAGALTVFGNGLKAHVTKDGRLISVLGSPVRNLPRLGTGTRLSAAQGAAVATTDAGRVARTSARAATGAQLVAFLTPGGIRTGWRVTSRTAQGRMYQHVVDAQDGRVLFRQSLSSDANPEALVHETSPGNPVGGTRRVVDLAAKGWLSPTATTLNGRYVNVTADVNGNEVTDPGERIRAGANSFRFPFTAFPNATPGCSTVRICTWDPKVPFSWKANRNANGAQVFYFVSNFHDHLEKAPIGFTRAAGNFDARDGDAVTALTLLGADTNNGLPGFNTDNAFMSTPPDGQAPEMGMYLGHNIEDPTDPFIAGNLGDEADVVYHEYTHGLSGRLVVDAGGNSVLNSLEAGSMGEGWSDWYAFDYLVGRDLVKDTAAPGQVLVGDYIAAGKNVIRSEPMDCPVGTTAKACPGDPFRGTGGYTYADLARGLEVHAGGEIWGQTLWDLRGALGVTLTRSLVTRAMELSPADPSFLDMRNAILQADQVVNGGRARSTIWKVFAHRGMGWFAAPLLESLGKGPVEDFSMPPAANTPKGTVTGRVLDDSGIPAAGVAVAFNGHTGALGDRYTATTGPDGRFSVRGVIAGTYPMVSLTGGGLLPLVRTVSVSADGATVNASLRRDWVMPAGGATVTSDAFLPFGDALCGPGDAVDGNQFTGWLPARYLTDTDGSRQIPALVARLPRAVDISSVRIDPRDVCGGFAGSARQYRVETSTDGVHFTVAAEGSFTRAQLGKLNDVPLRAGTGARVTHVRYTILDSFATGCPATWKGDTQIDPNCFFFGTAEIQVFGRAAA